jgi:ADP-ribose pyrophosphatase
MPSRVDVQRRRLILDDFFKVEEAHLCYERFDGSMSPVVRRLNLDRGDAAAALLHHTGRNSVILVNQFRYPASTHGPGWLTEAVAGMIDPGEDPETAVRREIFEETGYRADKLIHVSTFYVSPGGSSERVVLFCAEISGAPAEQHGADGEDEDIMLVELPLAEAFREVDRGEIADAKTLVALMWLRRRVGAAVQGG